MQSRVGIMQASELQEAHVLDEDDLEPGHWT
jgi:hypothetical protein